MVSFPDIGMLSIPAKVDTGAYRSAIHANNIHLRQTDNGAILAFDLMGDHVCSSGAVHLETHEFRQVSVENSFGHREDRFEVMLKVKVGPKVFRTGFTLANRTKKIYPILLGRTFLRGRFLVDVGKSSIDRLELKERFNVIMPIDEEIVSAEVL